jgi:hypothetical protein
MAQPVFRVELDASLITRGDVVLHIRHEADDFVRVDIFSTEPGRIAIFDPSEPVAPVEEAEIMRPDWTLLTNCRKKIEDEKDARKVSAARPRE